MLQLVQQKNVLDAVKLFTRAQIAFARCEANGFKIDVEYLNNKIADIEQTLKHLDFTLKNTEIWDRWSQKFGNKAKLMARQQLATILFNEMGFTSESKTESGLPEVTKEVLERLPGIGDFGHNYIQYMELYKVLNTNLMGIKNGMDHNGFLHPSFSLFSVVTYRTSCIAKGAMVRVGYGKHDVKPIEDIQVGDFVLCYRENSVSCPNEPVLSKVTWAGKTGHKLVRRITYKNDENEYALWHLDLTPDHLVRRWIGDKYDATAAIETHKHSYAGGIYDEEWDRYKSCSFKIVKNELLDDPVDVYDLEVEKYHNFIVNDICVHNCTNPNAQNFPKRSEELASMVRSCFIPREKDRHIVEVDYSGAEVRVNASINHDPVLVGSVTEGVDFHKAVAAKSYLLDESEVTKPLRQSVKGNFTFAAFYGSYWANIAKHLWDGIVYGGLTLKDGTPLLEHIKSKGIKELGNVNNPVKGTYYGYIKGVEDWFWNDQFKVYNQWKNDAWKAYLETGYIDLPSGFRCGGIFGKNNVSNAPAQGTAAHCLLWSFIEIDKELRRRGSKACICGQIHDSIIMDIPHEELDDILCMAQDIMTVKLREHFKWISVPMEVEADVAPMGRPWWECKGYEIKS